MTDNAPDSGSDPDWWRELVAGFPARTAKLAVTRADGSPHVAPVWADLDGDQIVFMTSAETVKGKSIRRDGRVCLCWDDDRPPFDFVIIRGHGRDVHRPRRSPLLGHADRRSLHGAEQADAYGERNAVPPEMVVRVTPTRVVAERAISDF